MVEEAKKPKSKINIFSLFGYLLGGLSLLNLIEELSPMELYGKLNKWMAAYTTLVDQIGDFMFGWIDFYWIGVNQLENHLLILTIIYLSADLRSEIRFSKKYSVHQNDKSMVLGLTFFGGLFIVLLPILILPGMIGFIAGIFSLLFIIITSVSAPSAKFNSPKLIISHLYRRGKSSEDYDIKLKKAINDKRKDHYFESTVRLKEITGILIVFTILIVLNYTIFMT